MRRKREHYVTCGQMKILERRADADGLSYYQMMENAGHGAAEVIMDKMAYMPAVKEERVGNKLTEYNKAAEKILTQLPIGKEDVFAKHLERTVKSSNNNIVALVFCGKGNNGGDGFVVARILHEAGYEVTVILVDGEPKTEDAVTNFGRLKNLPVKVMDMDDDPRALMKLKETADVIIDAIYGTGFHGKLSGNALKAAIYINKYSKAEHDEIFAEASGSPVVFALDIPSGMGGDLTNIKELDSNSVTAHCTITFHSKKPVHLQKFAQDYCGEIEVVDIGIDEERLWKVDIWE